MLRITATIVLVVGMSMSSVARADETITKDNGSITTIGAGVSFLGGTSNVNGSSADTFTGMIAHFTYERPWRHPKVSFGVQGLFQWGWGAKGRTRSITPAVLMKAVLTGTRAKGWSIGAASGLHIVGSKAYFGSRYGWYTGGFLEGRNGQFNVTIGAAPMLVGGASFGYVYATVGIQR